MNMRHDALLVAAKVIEAVNRIVTSIVSSLERSVTVVGRYRHQLNCGSR